MAIFIVGESNMFFKNEPVGNINYINEIPNCILMIILFFLGRRDLAHGARVSKRFNQLIKGKEFSSILNLRVNYEKLLEDKVQKINNSLDFIHNLMQISDKYLIESSGKYLHLINLNTLEKERTFYGHHSDIIDVKKISANKIISLCSEMFCLWDVTVGECLWVQKVSQNKLDFFHRESKRNKFKCFELLDTNRIISISKDNIVNIWWLNIEKNKIQKINSFSLKLGHKKELYVWIKKINSESIFLCYSDGGIYKVDIVNGEPSEVDRPTFLVSDNVSAVEKIAPDKIAIGYHCGIIKIYDIKKHKIYLNYHYNEEFPGFKFPNHFRFKKINADLLAVSFRGKLYLIDINAELNGDINLINVIKEVKIPNKNPLNRLITAIEVCDDGSLILSFGSDNPFDLEKNTMLYPFEAVETKNDFKC